MPDQQEFTIMIYHDGVHFDAPVAGKKRYVLEKVFLNTLVGRSEPPEEPASPLPPRRDYYELTDSEFDSYLAFRAKLKREGV